MERLFAIGLAIGLLISGVAAILITISLQLGIILILLAGILLFLFANPRSPVRKIWWSTSGKLGVVRIGNIGVGDEYLTIHIGLRAVSVSRVDKIVLRIGRKNLLSDWESTWIEADETRYVNFIRPDWLNIGAYEASIIAYTPDGFSKTEKFPVMVEK